DRQAMRSYLEPQVWAALAGAWNAAQDRMRRGASASGARCICSLDEKHGARPCSVRADDEGLLDVRGLRGTGDEAAVPRPREADLLVGLVHVVDQPGDGNDEREMLR